MKRILSVALFTALASCLVLFIPSRYAQTVKKLDLNVSYCQDGAPITILSATSDLDYFFTKAEVSNVSERRITSITVGVFMHETGGVSDSVLVSKHEIPTDLQPGATRSIDTFGVRAKVARQQAMFFKKTPVAVDFGVLEAQFEDGGTWHSTALDKKEFPSQKPALGVALQRKVGSIECGRSNLSTLLSKVLPSVFAQSGYFYNGSPIHEICIISPGVISSKLKTTSARIKNATSFSLGRTFPDSGLTRP
jgi:hypothetical protein